MNAAESTKTHLIDSKATARQAGGTMSESLAFLGEADSTSVLIQTWPEKRNALSRALRNEIGAQQSPLFEP